MGQQIDANVVLGEISSGVGFLVRGRGGWKAKVSFSCERQCRKHDSPWTCFYVFQPPFSRPGIYVWGECSRQLVHFLCPFRCFPAVFLLCSCCFPVVILLFHTEVALRSPPAQKCTLGRLPRTFVCQRWAKHRRKYSFRGDQFRGRHFGRRQGWLEGKSMALVWEWVPKTRFTLNMCSGVPATIFTSWNWCLGWMFPTIGPMSVPFSNDVMLMSCWCHADVTLMSCRGHDGVAFGTENVPLVSPVCIFVPKVTPAWPRHDLSMTSAWHQHSHVNRGTHTFEPQRQGQLEGKSIAFIWALMSGSWVLMSHEQLISSTVYTQFPCHTSVTLLSHKRRALPGAWMEWQLALVHGSPTHWHKAIPTGKHSDENKKEESLL